MTIFYLACDLCWVLRPRSSCFTLRGWCFLTSPQIPATFGAEIISFFKFFKFTVRTFWIWAFHCLLFGDSWASFVQLSPHGSISPISTHLRVLSIMDALRRKLLPGKEPPRSWATAYENRDRACAKKIKKKKPSSMDVELVVTMAISRSMLIIVTIFSAIYVVTSLESGVREQHDQINHKPNTLKKC